MVIELYVGSVAGRFAAWSPMFPGVIAFGERPDIAFKNCQVGCSALLKMKRMKSPYLPDPDLVDWVPRVGVPPPGLAAAYQYALDGAGLGASA